MVLRRIFGYKKEEVIGGRKKLHNELQNMYLSPNIILIINPKGSDRWRMQHAWVERRNAYRVLVGKPEGKSYLEDLQNMGG
jgi:hypothetical protein